MDQEQRPYFLWSEDLRDDQFRSLLQGAQGPHLQALYLGRLLREARVAEVWWYLTPQQVADHWGACSRHLGKMHRHWALLLEAWRDAGRISWNP